MRRRQKIFLFILLIWSLIIVSSFSSSQKTEPLNKVMATKESEVFLGKWEGFIEGKGGIKFQFVFEIMKNKDNTLQCLYSMPLQGLNGEPVQSFSIEGTTVNITIPLVMFTYSGSFINPQKIGLIGHSEGGFIAQIVASEIDEIAWIVLMAGPAISGKEIWLYQLSMFFKQGAFKEDPDKYIERIIALLDDEPNDDRAREKIDSIFKEMKYSPEMTKYLIEEIVSPWMRYFLREDPATFLSKVKCPVLALGGNKDVHVPSSRNLKAVEEILQKAGNKNFQTTELPKMNHLFQTANTGLPTEYPLIEETIAPVVLNTIGDWIIKQLK